jgi:serine protease AprX
MVRGGMRKRIALAGLVAAIALAGVLLFRELAVFGQGGPPLPPPAERIADTDRNKIFDNLDAAIAPASPAVPFRVIVLFTNPLDQVDFPGLRRAHGPFDIGFRYPSINGISTTLTKGQIQAVAALGVVKQVELDAIALPHLDKATLWFGVQKARTDFGVDGNAVGSPGSYSAGDIVVAVLDTGVNASHLDLNGGKVIGWKDFINGQLSPYDEGDGCVYHGSHVSSIATGEGDGNSAFTGVAPGAALVVVKVLGIQTTPPPRPQTACFGLTSQVNAGIQWVIDNKDTFGIEVMNMSLGVSGCANGTDSQSLLVNAVADAGIVPVVSAGNEGPATCTIGTPAAAPKAITVAAMADPEHGAARSFGCGPAPTGGFYEVCFSSRGPTLDGRVKPDVAGAGVQIMAVDGATPSGYKNLSGTSMASPFTAGVAALMQHARLLEGLPLLSPQALKNIVMFTAWDWGPEDGSAGSGPNADIDYGAGRLDAFKAIQAAKQASGTNISLPQHQFISDSVAQAGQAGDEDIHDVPVTDTSMGIGVTLIAPTWTGTQPDIVIELRNPSNVVVDSDCGFSRQNTVGVAPPTVTGTYTVRVVSFAPGIAQGCPTQQNLAQGAGGSYRLDISAGTGTVGLNVTTDGWIPFGIQALGATVDTTAGGLNDVQAFQLTAPPAGADLFIKTTLFSDGSNSWALGNSSGADQAVWEFSTNGSTWTKFTATNTLVSLAPGLSSGDTQNVFFRLTLPSSSSSSSEHGATATIVAVPLPPP